MTQTPRKAAKSVKKVHEKRSVKLSVKVAVIHRPFGKIEAGPHNRDKSVLYCDIEPAAAPRSRRSLDVAGHYARPDIFSLQINRITLPPVEFRDN